MPNPYDLTPEEFQAMLDATLADQRIALQGQNYKRGANDYVTPQPGGRNLGYTYVAGIAVFFLGRWVFQRLQSAFADVI